MMIRLAQRLHLALLNDRIGGAAVGAACAFVLGIAITANHFAQHGAVDARTTHAMVAETTEPHAAFMRFNDNKTLSDADRAYYLRAFEAQEAGNIAEANAQIAQIGNRTLVGYVLAERYLGAHYTSRAGELQQWLAQYSDHPQTARIIALAARRGVDTSTYKPSKKLQGDGYGEHLGRSTMPDLWYSGLEHWRNRNYGSAYTIFYQLRNDSTLGPWQRSAAAYWSYRAATRLGQSRTAHAGLLAAAEHPTSFYGQLARAKLGSATPRSVAPEMPTHLHDDLHAVRARLLVQLQRSDDAEEELRALFAESDNAGKRGLVSLAAELHLPNLQMRFASAPGLSDEEALFASYPTPGYVRQLDEVMDAALVLAVARNESGFREFAQSSAGARGIMQVMPATARAIERHVGETLLQSASLSDAPLHARLSDPALGARYGAEYLKLLTRTPAIGDNLIHILVGYNAGPGTVVSWKAAGRSIKDPLLYIESIPYPETRNYVMQVMAQYWIYQSILGEDAVTLQTLAHGDWPRLG